MPDRPSSPPPNTASTPDNALTPRPYPPPTAAEAVNNTSGKKMTTLEQITEAPRARCGLRKVTCTNDKIFHNKAGDAVVYYIASHFARDPSLAKDIDKHMDEIVSSILAPSE